MKGDPTLWLIARASGLTTYGLITASMLAGLLLRSRPAPSRIRPPAVMDAHRTLAMLALGALALHALRLKMGDEKFFQLLQQWYTVHQNGNVRTADFIALAAIWASLSDCTPSLHSSSFTSGPSRRLPLSIRVSGSPITASRSVWRPG